MGALTYDPVRIPIDSKEEAIEKPLSANGHTFRVTAIEIGNPHAIIYEQIEDEKTLSAIENHPFFPRRTNVECVTVVSENKIKVSMWERGAGVTYACGTGGCAVAVASERLGKVKLPVDVEFIGGTVNISWNEDKTKVYLTGPTKIVCQGEMIF